MDGKKGAIRVIPAKAGIKDTPENHG